MKLRGHYCGHWISGLLGAVGRGKEGWAGGRGGRGRSETMSTRPDCGGLGAINLSRPEEESQLWGGWSWLGPDGGELEGLGGQGQAAIPRLLPAWAICIKSLFHLQRGLGVWEGSVFLEKLERS